MAVREPLAVSVADAAKMLGISRAALYPIVMSGDIDSFTIGTRRLVTIATLKAWLESRARGGAGGAGQNGAA